MKKQTIGQDRDNNVKKNNVGIEPAEVLGVVLGKIPSMAPSSFGFIPFGKEEKAENINPECIPQTIDELGELNSYTYDLTVTQAASLSIPVAGSVSGGVNRRVVILEWTRFKACFDNDVEYRYGYVIRFCLTVNKWDVQGNLSLPFLSAQAQLGHIQASWLMQVRGLTGPQIDAVVLPPQDLTVETFVIAQQSLEKAILAINDPTTRFVSGILISKIDPTSPELVYQLAAVKAFAVDSVRRGRTLQAAQERLGVTDPASNDAITEVYNYFGVMMPNESPNSQARERARQVLRGISADV